MMLGDAGVMANTVIPLLRVYSFHTVRDARHSGAQHNRQTFIICIVSNTQMDSGWDYVHWLIV